MRGRRGFTLVELLLALGLLSILALALVRLLDTSLGIWTRTEASRDLSEMGTGVVDLLARDLDALEAGPRGDLLVEWVRHDTDGDGIRGQHWPRLRLVRQATAADLARLEPGGRVDPRALGLIEVAWSLAPVERAEADLASIGTLWRGERTVRDESTLSFFATGFFGANESPPPGALNEVTGGVLWFGLQLATQTSVVDHGWKHGTDLADSATCWDAWGRDRPDTGKSAWNEAAAGMPAAGELPLLPRRVRIELELERRAEVRRRPRLADAIDAATPTFRVTDERHLPRVGGMLLLGEEWMELQSVEGTRVSVLRARRGTRAAAHDADTLVHHGWRVVREVPIALHREDWDL